MMRTTKARPRYFGAVPHSLAKARWREKQRRWRLIEAAIAQHHADTAPHMFELANRRAFDGGRKPALVQIGKRRGNFILYGWTFTPAGARSRVTVVGAK